MSERKLELQRQGDVGLIRIDAIPDGAMPMTRDDRGRLVLAEGERTGHAHAVVSKAAELFTESDRDEMAARFLRVKATGMEIDSWKGRDPQTGGIGWFPAYQSASDVEACGIEIVGREKVEGVVIEHEEHLHFVVAPGDHKIARQREYTSADMEPIRVED